MTINNKKYYVIGLSWLAGGYLAWFAGLYTFSYVAVDIGQHVMEYLKSTSEAYFLIVSSRFLLNYLSAFFFVFLFAAFLSAVTDKPRLFWLLLFVVGAIGRSLYGDIEGMLFYTNYYASLPSWALSWFIQSLVALLIVVPLLTWLGVLTGRKYRERRSA